MLVVNAVGYSQRKLEMSGSVKDLNAKSGSRRGQTDRNVAEGAVIGGVIVGPTKR